MNPTLALRSFQAFHINGLNSLIYAFTTNWCLIFIVFAAVASVILGVIDQSSTVIREEQNIL